MIMIINGKSLLNDAPIVDMLESKERLHGVSYGLAEAGYDIRVKQEVNFVKPINSEWLTILNWNENNEEYRSYTEGKFTLASAIEEFNMPNNLVGVVHDKSTWARKGLSVFNTVIEPGWKGFLTLELVYHGDEPLTIPAGAGIAQILFHRTIETGEYDGKYQNQADRPVEAIYEKG